MPLQSHLSSLSLVRLLQEWVPVAAEPARQDVPERLGEWLGAFDSVKMDGALQAIASYGAQNATRPSRGAAVDARALEAACQHVKTDLTKLIDARLAAPVGEADYAPHLQCHAELQKQMEAKVSACRAQVRQALSKGSPRMRQLAALDQVMTEMLGEREQKLLSSLPVYMERRFAHWRQLHQQRIATGGDADAQKADDLQCWQEQGGWLHGFRQDMRRMLLAELQARLQAILGLIEAVQAAQAEHNGPSR